MVARLFPMFPFIPPEKIRETGIKIEHWEEMGYEIKNWFWEKFSSLNTYNRVNI